MPPRLYSRYSFTRGAYDAQGRFYLTEREPYRYRDFPDTRVHIVTEGDTLWGLAARYFRALPEPALLWWVIADFQPDPIFDPTEKLATARVLYIPSEQTVLNRIFDETRQQEEHV